MKKIFIIIVFIMFFFQHAAITYAQIDEQGLSPTPEAITVTASPSATVQTKDISKKLKEITNPDIENQQQQTINKIFAKRKADTLTLTNIAPFTIKHAVKAGVPANTIVLILLLPVLATIVVMFRYLVGLSGIGLLVPIALSITLLATNITPGLIMLAAITFASLLSRFMLRRLPIMQMPKVALSMLVVAVSLLTALTISSVYGIIDVRNLSIFPILLFILLSDRIITLFLQRELMETLQTTLITFLLAILGFFLLTWEPLRTITLLYPELILLLVPINIGIGRYFGLRVTEYIKFQPILKHGNK